MGGEATCGCPAAARGAVACGGGAAACGGGAAPCGGDARLRPGHAKAERLGGAPPARAAAMARARSRGGEGARRGGGGGGSSGGGDVRVPAERASVLFLYIFRKSLPSVSYNTRQICHVVCSPEMAAFFGREMKKTHGKRFAVCPIKDTRQKSYLPADLCRELFAVCYTRQIFCHVYLGNSLCPVVTHVCWRIFTTNTVAFSITYI